MLNISGAIFAYIGPGVLPSAVSYLSYLLLLLYYLLIDKGALNKWMILIGLLYFVIAGFQYVGPLNWYLTNFLKYFIAVICGYEVVKRTSSDEFLLFLILGSLTILLHATLIQGGSADYGRFSGFYINPNGASFICSSGYALSFTIKNKRLRLIAQLILTAMGLLTLSRTFIATWILLNLLALRIDVKNAKIFLLGFALVLALIGISELLPVKNVRIEQLKRLTENERVEMKEINDDSRTDTWAKFYEDLMGNPVFGMGYYTFQGGTERRALGVHNTFLLIQGEAGFIPTLTFIIFYLYMFISGIQLFKVAPNLLMQVFVLVLFLAVSHIYFTHHFILMISMWIQYQIEQKKLALQ